MNLIGYLHIVFRVSRDGSQILVPTRPLISRGQGCLFSNSDGTRTGWGWENYLGLGTRTERGREPNEDGQKWLSLGALIVMIITNAYFIVPISWNRLDYKRRNLKGKKREHNNFLDALKRSMSYLTQYPGFQFRWSKKP